MAGAEQTMTIVEAEADFRLRKAENWVMFLEHIMTLMLINKLILYIILLVNY